MKFFQSVARRLPRLPTRFSSKKCTMNFFRNAACKLPRLPLLPPRFCSKKSAQLDRQGSQLLKRWNVPWTLDTAIFGLVGLEACFHVSDVAFICYTSYTGITAMDPEVFYGSQLALHGFGGGMQVTALYGLCRFYRPIPGDVLYWRFSRTSFLYGLVGVALFGSVALALPAHLPNFEQYAENPAVKRRVLIFSTNVSTISSFLKVNLAGFTEEIVYRGFFLASLTKWVAAPTAVVLSSTCFGLSHLASRKLEWSSFLQHFLFGLASGVAYLHSRNVAAPILLHCGYNSALFVYCLLEFKRVCPSGFYEQVVFQKKRRGQ